MKKKSARPRFIGILTLLGLSLFLISPIQAQQNVNPLKSLSQFFEDFETAQKLPCGQRSDAIRIGGKIVEELQDYPPLEVFIESLKKQIAIIEKEDKWCQDKSSLENIFENFKSAKKAGCDERIVAITIGKRIIENFGDDEINQDVIGYVKNQLPIIEEQARICRRNERYNDSYKSKNWNEFFAVSKQIIEEEGAQPLALDVMLSLVAVGFDRTAYNKVNFYNSDTIYYAQKAIELIESGIQTQSRWGVFEPFKTKENALGWLNYTIGYISYFRLKENKKAIPYFYKATQYKSEFKYDAFVYQAVAIYYFDQESSMASSLTINDFITKAINITNSFDDGAGSSAGEATAKKDEIAVLYRQLVNLYNLRYNLAPDENVTGLADYIQKLINRPLINPSIKEEAKQNTPPK